MTNGPKVVITLPAYRAERTLEKTVRDIPKHMGAELILVDDASPDNTAELARSLGIRVHVHPANRGYGGNQKTCYTIALAEDADIIVLLHPDYQYEPKAVPLLIAPILAGDADMTFGSRFAGLGDPRAGGMPFYRYLGNRTTTILQNLILGTRFTEMHSGMRAYTRECLLSLPWLSYPDDFRFDAELLIDAVTAGERVIEVPIPTRYTKESSSIALPPLVRYVFGGLKRSLKRSAGRGRRGTRRPVSDAPRHSSEDATHSWILDTLESYHNPSRTIMANEEPPGFRAVAQQRRWAFAREDERAGAIVVFSSGDPEQAAGFLKEASVKGAPEGLALVLGSAPSEEHPPDAALAANGTKIIEIFVRGGVTQAALGRLAQEGPSISDG